MIDLQQPRSVAEILVAALRLYGRHPLTVIGLALIVRVPYDLIVLAVAHAAPFGQQRASTETVIILAAVALAVVQPLVSALQVQVLVGVATAERPVMLSAIRRILRVVPVVVAAEIIAWIGIGIGLALFLLPGIYLLLRWSVVVQVVAVEGADWPTALRRSAELARANYLRILGVIFVMGVVILALTNGVAAAVGTSHRVGPVIIGIAVDVLTAAFEGLVIGLLYFDLRARSS